MAKVKKRPTDQWEEIVASPPPVSSAKGGEVMELELRSPIELADVLETAQYLAGGGHGIAAGQVTALLAAQEAQQKQLLAERAAGGDAPPLTTLEQALQMLVTAPRNVSVERIAKKLGVTRQALYKYRGFRAAWKAWKVARKNANRIRRGSKSKEGSLEAIDDDS